jgi:glycogenin glucosyltransferase
MAIYHIGLPHSSLLGYSCSCLLLTPQGQYKLCHRVPDSGVSNINVHGRKKAIVSMVQNEDYLPMALVLGYTLQKYNQRLANDGIDQVMLVPYEHDMSPTSLARLKKVGWTIRYEQDVAVEGTETLYVAYQRNFLKLRLWSWTEYAKVGFIDADCMVRGDVSLLVSDKFGTCFTPRYKAIFMGTCLLTWIDFAAVQDTWPEWMPADNFNAGILSLRPSLSQYHSLLNATSSVPLGYTAEQGFLNIMFLPTSPENLDSSRYLRTELPMKYNLNLCAYSFHREKWDAIWPDARIVHFTMVKPCLSGRNEYPDYDQPVNLWWKEWDEMSQKFGWGIS